MKAIIFDKEMKCFRIHFIVFSIKTAHNVFEIINLI
jgi:hypothetical protein